MKRAAECGTSFDQFLKPMDISDVMLFTDVALSACSERHSNHRHWFKNNWIDIQLHPENDRDVVWKELIAKFAFLHSLRQSSSHS